METLVRGIKKVRYTDSHILRSTFITLTVIQERPLLTLAFYRIMFAITITCSRGEGDGLDEEKTQGHRERSAIREKPEERRRIVCSERYPRYCGENECREPESGYHYPCC